jgi:hypothetical protein
VATKEIYDLVSSDPPPILIDALRSSHIGTIPGAVRIPFAGFPGDWSDQHQRRLKVRLDNLTNGNLDATLVFFCVGTNAGNRTMPRFAPFMPDTEMYIGIAAGWRRGRRLVLDFSSSSSRLRSSNKNLPCPARLRRGRAGRSPPR